ncbi:MAG: hypothetical protein ACK5JN_02875 [Kluyvera sp.]|uniref:hypothetical protein n=1 Tax=Kluyvera sp. TaxID=1538228 RepID=UPI003A8AE0A2
MNKKHMLYTLLFVASSCLAAEPELSMGGFIIGDDVATVKNKADENCQIFTIYKEDEKAAALTKRMYGNDNVIYSCINPKENKMQAHRLLLEIDNNRLITIFADILPDGGGAAFEWIMNKFGGPTEVSNAYEAHEANNKQLLSEQYAYLYNRNALFRERINGNGEDRIFLYVMDADKQKILPFHAPYFR